MEVRKRIAVEGIVQGVGFRPFVYRLATACGLAGSIANTSAGVSIEVQGMDEAVEEFLARLPAEAPPLARITSVQVRESPCNGERGFQILPSQADAEPRALISPDVTVCADCLRELFDPANRRFLYAFINCTNCGPRFTIVRDIPYDRPRTSMSVFPMCLACQAEYDDPSDRRFHAQPNACWECGPRVGLWDHEGTPIQCHDPIAEAASRIQLGAIVAVKGLGGFHVACDAADERAVARLRERKRRVQKPFALMVRDIATAKRLCCMDGVSEELLLSPQRPIVLLPRKQPITVADDVAPGNRYLGIFLPYAPLHYLLFAAGSFPALVMTSGNLSEEPIAIDNREAIRRLEGLVDFFLIHDRDILRRCDDSVVRVVAGRTRQVRRSRGYVPVPIFLHQELPAILAVGGELKNTICLTRGREAFLSQHIGDLENLEAHCFFAEAVAHLEHILEVQPRIVAYDLHPDYFSTQWALAQPGVERIGVQHHHAHVAACMAENNLKGRVIGIVLDGTGYGTDRTIWGGEVLLADYRGFHRTAHLRPVPMPGAAAAIHEPWRMAVSHLAQQFGRAFLDWRLPFLEQLDRPRVEALLHIIDRGVNSPLTSSCGRLFDAVAAVAGVRLQVSYEAQAAIELENCMADSSADNAAYPLAIVPEGGAWLLDTRPLFEALVHDVLAGAPPGVISRRFHNGLAEGFAQLAVLLKEQTGLDRVCLSGGCFQNAYLLERLQAWLEAGGLSVFTHSEVPAGDGGLSLGQALVAAHQLLQGMR